MAEGKHFHFASRRVWSIAISVSVCLISH